jgi:hypothetical protein
MCAVNVGRDWLPFLEVSRDPVAHAVRRTCVGCRPGGSGTADQVVRSARDAVCRHRAGAVPGRVGRPTGRRAELGVVDAVSGLLRGRRWEPGLAGVRALRDKTLDVDLLMVAAAIGAAATGQVTDGALLIVIFATFGALEALATARTEDSVRGLLDLAPQTATVLTGDDDERTVPAADLEIGDVVLIRPGERIAADGTVIAGASEVDQASITGEPLPVDETVDSEVFAGTLRHGIAAGAGRPSRDGLGGGPDRDPGRAGQPDQGPHPVVHREGRAALLDRHGHRHGRPIRPAAAVG